MIARIPISSCVAAALIATVATGWSAAARAQIPAVCNYIVQAANDGQTSGLRRPATFPDPGVPEVAALGSVTYSDRFDLNGDGREEYVYVLSQGTSRAESLYVYDSDLQLLNYSVPYDDYWVQEVFITTYEDVHYIVGKNDDRLIYAATITANGEPNIVCRFDQRPQPAARIVESTDDRACAVALNGTPEYAIFDRLHVYVPERRRGRGQITAGEFAARVDFDNDGDDDWVVEVEYSSAAGDGCAHTHLAALDDTRSELARTPAGDLLESVGGTCRATYLRPFRFEGQVYLEDKFSPGFATDYSVYKIDGGAVSTVCRIRARAINFVLGF